MNLRLFLLELYMPSVLKKRMLRTLFRITAEAFRCSVPPCLHRQFRACLREYADFTRIQAERAISRGKELDEVRERLFRNAYDMGQALRRHLGIASREDVLRVLTMLYRSIGIDLREEAGEQVVVTRCFFSTFYRPEVCALISSLDEGIAAGLSGGGELRFSRRITQGDGYCEAHFDMVEHRR